MDWIKVKVSHAEYDMSAAPLEVFKAWIMMMIFVAARERVPTDDQLDARLGKDIHKKLKAYLLKTGVSEKVVIQKVMEDIDAIKYKRIKGKERQERHYKTLHNASHNALVTPLGTGADKIREDKIREDEIKPSRFEDFWNLYPKRVGMSMALITFRATIKTDDDFNDLMLALANYKKSKEVRDGFVKNGDRWIEDWRGWIPEKKKMAPPAKPEPPPVPMTEEQRKEMAKAIAKITGKGQ